MNFDKDFANFDREFEKRQKQVHRLAIVGIVFWLAVFCGLGYVAFHFISKWW